METNDSSEIAWGEPAPLTPTNRDEAVAYLRDLMAKMDAHVEIDPYTGLEFWGDAEPTPFTNLMIDVEDDHVEPLCSTCLVHAETWINTYALQAELEGFAVPPPGTPYDGPRWPWLTG